LQVSKKHTDTKQSNKRNNQDSKDKIQDYNIVIIDIVSFNLRFYENLKHTRFRTTPNWKMQPIKGLWNTLFSNIILVEHQSQLVKQLSAAELALSSLTNCAAVEQRQTSMLVGLMDLV